MHCEVAYDKKKKYFDRNQHYENLRHDGNHLSGFSSVRTTYIVAQYATRSLSGWPLTIFSAIEKVGKVILETLH